MKNIFAFPRYSEADTGKIVARTFKVIAVVVACFIASLFVMALVSDRIDRSDKAIQSVSGLSRFQFDPSIVIEKTGPSRIAGQYRFLVSGVDVTVQGITAKKLGNQDVPVYSGTISSVGNFKSDIPGLLSLEKGEAAQYRLMLSPGSDEKTVSMQVNGIPFSDFALSESPYGKSVVISADKVQDNSEFKIAYSFTGISRMTFDDSHGSSDGPQSYKVSMHPQSDNIRLSNSGNSTYDQKNGLVSMTVSQYDGETGITFLPGSDDITFVDRILKYAILFISIVFALAFFIDLRKGLAFNIIQYFLMGISLALFYLLVLALGEQIGYLQAYVIASVSTALLNGWYIAEVFSSRKIGTGFGISLAVLYAIMYYLIHVTSVNLLLGTFTLYAILIVFMVASKNSNRR